MAEPATTTETFTPAETERSLPMAAVERAREFQRRIFGGRVLMPASAELIEEDRRERTERLP